MIAPLPKWAGILGAVGTVCGAVVLVNSDPAQCVSPANVTASLACAVVGLIPKSAVGLVMAACGLAAALAHSTTGTGGAAPQPQ